MLSAKKDAYIASTTAKSIGHECRSFHNLILSTTPRTNLSPLLRLFSGQLKSQLHLWSCCFIVLLVFSLGSSGKAREYGAYGRGPERCVTLGAVRSVRKGLALDGRYREAKVLHGPLPKVPL